MASKAPSLLSSVTSRSSVKPALFLTRRQVLLPVQQTRCLRSIMKPPIFSRFNQAPNLPILESSPKASMIRRSKTMPLRTGVLGKKKGMSSVFDPETGHRTPVTIVQLDRVQVVGHKTEAKHGYYAVQVGHGFRSEKNETRAMMGVFEQAGVSIKEEIVEFMIKDASGLPPIGTTLPPSWFRIGEFVDAKSDCKGKGFAGPMKKWGMKGQPRSHGVSLTHRSLGSAGQSQGGGSRVYPGKRMAGRMGGQQVTVHNCKIVQVDDANGLIILHGCIAGPKGCTVKLQDARKKAWPDVPSVPLELLPGHTTSTVAEAA